ncbi:MAG: HAD-IIIA family hydrolase [Alphaproteobacteria bacterium]|nr:HAD-IIIA family hydrolase [Alphaproteobacteria bacterium]
MSDRSRCLFLDRDGVINWDFGYVGTVERFKFSEGIFDFLRKAEEKGFLLAIVSNQSGVKKGHFTMDDYCALEKHIIGEFKANKINIALMENCFEIDDNHPDRKPNPGMILRAAKKLGVDLTRSIMIGDKVSDIRAGLNARVGLNLWFLPDSPFIDKNYADTPDVLKEIASMKEKASQVKVVKSFDEALIYLT